jgi:hypothetical protein
MRRRSMIRTTPRRVAGALLLAMVAGCGGKASEVDTAVVTPDPNAPAPKPAPTPAPPPQNPPTKG